MSQMEREFTKWEENKGFLPKHCQSMRLFSRAHQEISVATVLLEPLKLPLGCAALVFALGGPLLEYCDYAASLFNATEVPDPEHSWFNKYETFPVRLQRFPTQMGALSFLILTVDLIRTLFKKDDFSDNVKKAVIATEDENFFNSHNGLKPKAVIRYLGFSCYRFCGVLIFDQQLT